MINRKVSNSSDELGNEEMINEFDIVYREGADPLVEGPEYRPLHVNPHFKVKFSDTRMETFNTIRDNYLREQHSLYVMYTNTPLVAQLTKSIISNTPRFNEVRNQLVDALNITEEVMMKLVSETQVLLTLVNTKRDKQEKLEDIEVVENIVK